MEYPEPISLTNDVWMVPCKISPDKRVYKPVSKPQDHVKKIPFKRNRSIWSLTEDKILKELVLTHRARNWVGIAKEINMTLYNSFPNRTGKQCRERWLNQINPLIKKSSFTAEEDNLLLAIQKKLGNKWSKISEFFTGRTENHLKNRWKLLKRKKNKKIVQLKNSEQNFRNENDNEKNTYFLFSGENSPCSLEDIDTEYLLCSDKLYSEGYSKKKFCIGDILPSFDDELNSNYSFFEESIKDEDWKALTTDIVNEVRIWEENY